MQENSFFLSLVHQSFFQTATYSLENLWSSKHTSLLLCLLLLHLYFPSQYGNWPSELRIRNILWCRSLPMLYSKKSHSHCLYFQWSYIFKVSPICTPNYRIQISVSSRCFPQNYLKLLRAKEVFFLLQLLGARRYQYSSGLSCYFLAMVQLFSQ